MQKNIIIALGLIVITAIAALTWNHTIVRPGRVEPPVQGSSRDPYEPTRATLSGIYLCLPHANAEGSQTLECALGLKTDDGKYYALDFSLLSQSAPNLSTGERIEASGILTPIERLSTDHWQKYPIVGIFSVTDSVKKL